jgi:hypothetical protein
LVSWLVSRPDSVSELLLVGPDRSRLARRPFGPFWPSRRPPPPRRPPARYPHPAPGSTGPAAAALGPGNGRTAPRFPAGPSAFYRPAANEPGSRRSAAPLWPGKRSASAAVRLGSANHAGAAGAVPAPAQSAPDYAQAGAPP